MSFDWNIWSIIIDIYLSYLSSYCHFGSYFGFPFVGLFSPSLIIWWLSLVLNLHSFFFFVCKFFIDFGLQLPWGFVNPKGNQSWIFFGRTHAEAETPISGHLMQRTNALEKTLTLGKTKGRRRKGRLRMRSHHHHWMASLTHCTSLNKLWELVMDREAWHAAVHGSQRVGHEWMTELMRFLYNSLYTYIIILSCWSLNFKCILKLPYDNYFWDILHLIVLCIP